MKENDDEKSNERKKQDEDIKMKGLRKRIRRRI